MTENEILYLLARVTIPITEDMPTLVEHLTILMPGFIFEDDLSCRFEEVPAFVAEQHGMEFILMGIPDGETGDEYVLEFDCETRSPISEFLEQDPGSFIRQFVREKPVNERGFMDFSEELAQLLIQHGIAGCKPILPIT